MSDASSNQHGKANFELDLGRIGFVVIIPVMLWVFYTTLSGLVDIMRKGPDDNFGLVGAVIGSAAIRGRRQTPGGQRRNSRAFRHHSVLPVFLRHVGFFFLHLLSR
jgi:hypothetical protein